MFRLHVIDEFFLEQLQTSETKTITKNKTKAITERQNGIHFLKPVSFLLLSHYISTFFSKNVLQNVIFEQTYKQVQAYIGFEQN